jgi:hypothetical protein
LSDGLFIAHVGPDNLRRTGQMNLSVTVHLINQRIEDTDLISISQKFFRDMAANEAATTSNKNT